MDHFAADFTYRLDAIGSAWPPSARPLDCTRAIRIDSDGLRIVAGQHVK